jgi:hypothetical protein
MQIVYPNGNSGDITIPAAESIAVYTKGTAKVYRKVGYPNYPTQLSLLGTVDDEQTVFGSYSSGATIVIESAEAHVYFEVGTAPIVQFTRVNQQVQVTPSAKTTAVTLTSAELLTGIITATHTAGATAAYTLPTGTLLDAAGEFAVNDSFDWSLINLSAAAADTVTLTAGTGHTIVGGVIVQSAHASTGTLYGNSVRWRTRKTAANTFVTYRLS